MTGEGQDDGKDRKGELWHVLLTRFLIETDWSGEEGSDALCDLVLMSHTQINDNNNTIESEVDSLRRLLASPLCLGDSVTHQPADITTGEMKATHPAQPQWHTAFFAFVLCATSYLHWSHPCNGNTNEGITEATRTFQTAFIALYKSETRVNEGEKETMSVLEYMPYMPVWTSLWRQPALLAALHALADAVWRQQAHTHFIHNNSVEDKAHNSIAHSSEAAEEEEEDECEECCALCVACALNRTMPAEALWCLLLWHLSFSGTSDIMDSDNTKGKGHEENTSDEAALHLLWRHASVACRSALYNHADCVLGRILTVWVVDKAYTESTSSATQAQNGLLVRVFADTKVKYAESMSWSLFVLLQCNMLVRQLAFAAHYANHSKSTNDNAVPLSTMLRCDEEHVLHCLQSLYDACRICGPRACNVFVYVTCYMPYAYIDGRTLLTWLCMQRPYIAPIRLVLYAAQRLLLNEDDDKAEGNRFAPTSYANIHTEDNKKNDAVALPLETSTAAAYRVVFATSTTTNVNTSPTTHALSSLTCSVALSHCISSEAFNAVVTARDISLARLLLLAGASCDSLEETTLTTLIHDATTTTGNSEDDSVSAQEMLWLLCHVSEMLEGENGQDPLYSNNVTVRLAERVRHGLCAAATADVLAHLSYRLWREKVRLLPQPTPYTTSTSTTSDICEVMKEMMVKWKVYWAAQDRVLRPALASLAYDPHNVLTRVTLLQVFAHKLHECMTVVLQLTNTPTEGNTNGNDDARVVLCALLRYTATVARMYEQLSEDMHHVERSLRVRAHLQRYKEQHAAMMYDVNSEARPDVPWKDAESITHLVKRLEEDKNTLLSQWYAMATEHISLLRPMNNNFNEGSSTTEPEYTEDNIVVSAGITPLRVLLQNGQHVYVELPMKMDHEQTLTQCGGAYGIVVKSEILSSVPWLQGEVLAGDLVAFQRSEAHKGCYVVTHHFSLHSSNNEEVRQAGSNSVTSRTHTPRVTLSCVEKSAPTNSVVALKRVEYTLCGVPWCNAMQPLSSPLVWLEVRPASSLTTTEQQQQQQKEVYTTVLGEDIVSTLMQRPQQWQAWERLIYTNSCDVNGAATLWLREVRCDNVDSSVAYLSKVHQEEEGAVTSATQLAMQCMLGRIEFALDRHNDCPLEGHMAYVLQRKEEDDDLWHVVGIVPDCPI